MANELIEHIKGLSHGERKLLLEQNADKIEKGKYQKTLTQEEIEGRYQTVALNMKDVYGLEQEKKEVMAEFKEKLDPLIKSNKTLVREIATGQTEINGTLYHLANHISGMMETYDDECELVASRRLLPAEKQLSITNPLRKTAE